MIKEEEGTCKSIYSFPTMMKSCFQNQSAPVFQNLETDVALDDRLQTNELKILI